MPERTSYQAKGPTQPGQQRVNYGHPLTRQNPETKPVTIKTEWKGSAEGRLAFAGRMAMGYIRKSPDKDEWCVRSESGKNMGCYPSKSKAEDRLRQIEYFKHVKGELAGLVLLAAKQERTEHAIASVAAVEGRVAGLLQDAGLLPLFRESGFLPELRRMASVVSRYAGPMEATASGDPSPGVGMAESITYLVRMAHAFGVAQARPVAIGGLVKNAVLAE